MDMELNSCRSMAPSLITSETRFTVTRPPSAGDSAATATPRMRLSATSELRIEGI
jgi:hypothetical protein